MTIHAFFISDRCKSWPLDGDAEFHFQSAEMFLTLPEEHSPRSLSSPESEHPKAAQREEQWQMAR